MMVCLPLTVMLTVVMSLPAPGGETGLIGLDAGAAVAADKSGTSAPAERAVPARFDVSRDKTWKLVWSDEFDGTTIDPGKWQILTEGPNDLGAGWPKGYRKAENVYLDGEGHAVIRFSRDRNGDLIVGGMRSRAAFLYGYFEARLKLSTQPGWWAAFWLYRERMGPNPFLHGLEVDIVEDFPGKGRKEKVIQEALHSGIPSAYAKSFTRLTRVDDWNAFHVFGLKWTPIEYVFYVDGVEVLRWGKEQAVTTKPCRVWLSANTGSAGRVGFTGDYRDAVLPDYYVIDYVRVYEKDHGDNRPPRVEITAPPVAVPLAVREGGSVTVDVSAEDPDGTIRAVHLFDNGYLIETRTAFPYRFRVTFDETHYSKTFYMRPADQRGVRSLLTEHVFVAMAEDDDARIGISGPLRLYVESVEPSRPYRGRPQVIPGRIELQYFDEGGQGVAYNDADDINHGALAAGTAFRVGEGVDTDGRRIGWIHDGEWLRYTVDVLQGGRYAVVVPFASPEAGENRGILLEVDGRPVADIRMSSATGGWNRWTSVTGKSVTLTKGRHVLTVRVMDGLFNLDYIDFILEGRLP
ncbi:MAG: family 16 glycosylhydrolase [Nitrospirae bacterium]|nr:family 16 glycosylhydrolase [Nitrospirota bacterium]